MSLDLRLRSWLTCVVVEGSKRTLGVQVLDGCGEFAFHASIIKMSRDLRNDLKVVFEVHPHELIPKIHREQDPAIRGRFGRDLRDAMSWMFGAKGLEIVPRGPTDNHSSVPAEISPDCESPRHKDVDHATRAGSPNPDSEPLDRGL